MKRRIDKWLQQWRQQDSREVLLVRGARQVGETYSIRELGRSFNYYIEVNFEELRDVHSFFKGNLTTGPICEKLSAYFGIPIIAGQTLLFFDEVHVKDFQLEPDGHGGKFVDIRDGSVNWPSVMQALAAIKYRGWMTIEGSRKLPVPEQGKRLDQIIAGE